MTRNQTEIIILAIDIILADIEKYEAIEIVGDEWHYKILGADRISYDVHDAIDKLLGAKRAIMEEHGKEQS